MKEDDIFKEAELHFGPKFNRAQVAAFANAIHAAGIKRGSEMMRAVNKDMTEILKASANMHCRGCDGTGIFYGNVSVCGCTVDAIDLDALAAKMAKAAKIHALFVGPVQGHADIMEAARKAVDIYRREFESPGARYWYHDESDCFFTTGTEAEVELMIRASAGYDMIELSRQEYDERLKAQEAAALAKPEPEDDEEI